MKTLTTIFLVFAFSSFAQQNDEWITPFATVEFRAGKIMYYYADADPVLRLTPVFIPGNLLVINNPMRMVEPETFQYWKETIGNLASASNYAGENREEKLHFLKAFTLQTIWSMSNQDDLPPTQAYETVTVLTGSNDKTIAENAGLARDLFESVQNYYQSKNQ